MKIRSIEKSIERLIEMKYITVSKYVTNSGVASVIASDLDEQERERQKNEEINKMIQIMEKHFPGKLEEVFKIISQ